MNAADKPARKVRRTPGKPVAKTAAPGSQHAAPAKPAAPMAVKPVTARATPPSPVTPSVSEPAAAPVPTTAKDETMDNTINTATDKTQAMFADANDRAKGAMEKGARMFQDMGDFNKGNIEALVESSKIAARGFETMGQNAAEYVRQSFEGATQNMKTLSSVKSPTEFLKLQGDFTRSAFDAMVAEASRSTEAMLKMAGEIAQPLSNRFAVAAEKVKVAA